MWDCFCESYFTASKTQYCPFFRRKGTMCYLVAKDTEKRGCYALKTTHGEHLVKLKRTLNKEVGVKGIQLVTISRPTAYGEYAPYTFAKNEQEFKALVRDMRA